MKFAILSLAATAALALSVGTASAQPWGHHGGHHGHHGGYYGHHGGYYPPAYGYSSYGYNSGFGLTINRPGFNFSVGSGVSPFYNYSSFGYSPFGYGYSPFGYGGYGGWGW